MRDACPDLEILAAYLDGKLTRDEQRVIETHLSRCSVCRRIVSLAIKTEMDVPPTDVA